MPCHPSGSPYRLWRPSLRPGVKFWCCLCLGQERSRPARPRRQSKPTLPITSAKPSNSADLLHFVRGRAHCLPHGRRWSLLLWRRWLRTTWSRWKERRTAAEENHGAYGNRGLANSLRQEAHPGICTHPWAVVLIWPGRIRSAWKQNGCCGNYSSSCPRTLDQSWRSSCCALERVVERGRLY